LSPVKKKFFTCFKAKKCHLDIFQLKPIISESSSVDRAPPCQGGGRGFESRLSLSVTRMLFHFDDLDHLSGEFEYRHLSQQTN
jgi:hypothetical protein